MCVCECVCVQLAHRVGDHWEESNVEGEVWAGVLLIISASGRLEALWPGARNDATLPVVRDLARDIDDELQGAAEASSEVAVFGKLEIDVALVLLVAIWPCSYRRERQDLDLVRRGVESR